jgi:hypothetical protein
LFVSGKLLLVLHNKFLFTIVETIRDFICERKPISAFKGEISDSQGGGYEDDCLLEY